MVGNWGNFVFVSIKENFRLHPVSPCIEAGNNAADSLPPLDMGGDPRVMDGDNDGTATVDRGMDEVPFRLDGVIFVNDDATGANTGFSWGDAFNNLQDALDAAVSGESIWVAAGTYRPVLRSDPADPQSAAFRLKNGVAIYGGLDPASGIIQFEDRDWENNQTILSGDIGRIGDHEDNSYHVFYHPLALVPLNSTAVLDGFVISDGRAYPGNGGGVFNQDSSPNLTDCAFGDGVDGNNAGLGGGVYNRSASPSYTACRFEVNTADSGGGMYNESSAATLSDCTFDGNRVLGAADACRGGGMYCENSSPALTGCVFTWNAALAEASARGGGLFCDAASAPSLSGCRFENNWSQRDGGAIYCDGASPTISDTVISDNRAEAYHGGGIYCSPSSAPSITACTIEKNMAKYGGGIYCDGASPSIVQCQINANESILEGGGIFLGNSTPTHQPVHHQRQFSHGGTRRWLWRRCSD